MSFQQRTQMPNVFPSSSASFSQPVRTSIRMPSGSVPLQSSPSRSMAQSRLLSQSRAPSGVVSTTVDLDPVVVDPPASTVDPLPTTRTFRTRTPNGQTATVTQTVDIDPVTVDPSPFVVDPLPTQVQSMSAQSPSPSPQYVSPEASEPPLSVTNPTPMMTPTPVMTKEPMSAWGINFNFQTLIWFIIIPLAVWCILFAWKPDFVTDLVNGDREINNGKLLLWVVVISVILWVLLYFLLTSSRWMSN